MLHHIVRCHHSSREHKWCGRADSGNTSGVGVVGFQQVPTWLLRRLGDVLRRIRTPSNGNVDARPSRRGAAEYFEANKAFFSSAPPSPRAGRAVPNTGDEWGLRLP